MKKKLIVKLMCIICALIILYTIVWTAFYNFSVKPHISNDNGIVLEEKGAYGTYSDLYVPDETVEYTNKPYDNYLFYAPKLFSFLCYITSASSHNYDTETKKITNPGGSIFDYSMTATVNFFGKIKRFTFSISPLEDADNRYDDYCSIILDGNGELLGGQELSPGAINIYNDSKDEIKSVIDNTKAIYGF